MRGGPDGYLPDPPDPHPASRSTPRLTAPPASLARLDRLSFVGLVTMTPETWVERSDTVIERDGFVEAEIGRVTEE